MAKRKPLTDEQAMNVLKRYDPKLYEYYHNNAWYFGCGARNYAEYLLRQHEGQARMGEA